MLVVGLFLFYWGTVDMSNYKEPQKADNIQEVYESEKVFDYDVVDYDNWSAEWYEDEDPGFECSACFGSGLDRHEDADCINCWGEGRVYGTV